MFKRHIILAYLLVVFLTSYLWQFFIYTTGGADSKFIPILMWFPGVIAVLFIILNREPFRAIGWGLKGWRYIFPAIFIPLLISILLMGLFKAMNWGDVQEGLMTFKEGHLESTRIGLLLGKGQQSIPFFLFNLFVSHLFFLLGGSLFTLGEELGWRGYLQGKLIRTFGITKGLLFLGIIWGYWHLPIVLMGYNFPDHPILGAILLMPLGTIFLGVFLGWLYIRSGSIWIPALAHASINLFSGFPFGMTLFKDELLLASIWILFWGILCFYCLWDFKRKPTQISQMI